jgi:hypothetical protein
VRERMFSAAPQRSQDNTPASATLLEEPNASTEA